MAANATRQESEIDRFLPDIRGRGLRGGVFVPVLSLLWPVCSLWGASGAPEDLREDASQKPVGVKATWWGGRREESSRRQREEQILKGGCGCLLEHSSVRQQATQRLVLPVLMVLEASGPALAQAPARLSRKT